MQKFVVRRRSTIKKNAEMQKELTEEQKSIFKEELAQGLIPIESEAKRFFRHLTNHPRTIFSAKFGEGKSYFLSHLRKCDCDEKDDFVFLTLFPLHYQVVPNGDIFKLIKYDLLIQMLLNDMVPTEYELPQDQINIFAIAERQFDVITTLITFAASLGMPTSAISQMVMGVRACKVFRQLEEISNKKSEEIKNECDPVKVESFLQETEKIASIEFDTISRIIVDCIEIYRQKNAGKKVALVLEDLDRLDPAHMFRILNVFSCHIDFAYRWRPYLSDTDIKGNKFGVDNIVVVLDYDNLKNTYCHLYGNAESFEGYISKFTSGDYFAYSLSGLRRQYIYNKLAMDFNMDVKFIERFITPEELSAKSLREIYNKTACVQSMKFQTKSTHIVKNATPNVCFLKFIKFFKILNITDTPRHKIMESFLKDSVTFLQYAAYYILEMEKAQLPYIVHFNIDDYSHNGYEIKSIDSKGIAEVKHYHYQNSAESYNNAKKAAEYILALVDQC